MGTLEAAVITIRMAAQPPTYGASAPLEQQAGVPPPYQGYAPAPQQGFPIQQGQGYAPPPPQGYAPPPQQGFGPPPQQGFPPPQTVQVTVQGNVSQTGLLFFNHVIPVWCVNCLRSQRRTSQPRPLQDPEERSG